MGGLRVGAVLRVTWLDTLLDASVYNQIRVTDKRGSFIEVVPMDGARRFWVPEQAIREATEILTPATHPELAVALLQRSSGQLAEKQGNLYLTTS